MNKHNNYAILITKLVTVMAVLASVYFAVLIINGSKNKDNPKQDMTIAMPCSDQEATTILKDASAALDPAYPENIANLGQISDTILSYESHQDDANCLYVLTTRYVYASDYSNARKYLDLLSQKRGKGGGTALPRNFLTFDELSSNVDFLSRKKDEIERNNPYGLEL